MNKEMLALFSDTWTNTLVIAEWGETLGQFVARLEKNGVSRDRIATYCGCSVRTYHLPGIDAACTRGTLSAREWESIYTYCGAESIVAIASRVLEKNITASAVTNLKVYRNKPVPGFPIYLVLLRLRLQMTPTLSPPPTRASRYALLTAWLEIT